MGPLLFLIYINDLPDNINSEVYMYTDDTKIYREIKTIEDQTTLQSDLDTLTRWSDVWLLKFHQEKCFHLSIGKNEEHESSYHMIIDNVKHDMTHIEEIKDIGVVVDKNLKFEKHINAKIETANKILGIIRRTYMCVGPTKGTYRRDIKMIVNHDYIKQCIIFAKNFFS